ncbi:hypothetical protein HYU16_03260 [Candidatus Woesearchaeota archaeon]|nr:hypothetical protein [Candidatus Woesearchaeota archaeon]
MKFRNDDNIRSSRDLTDAVTKEHPKHFIAVAEQQIMAMHSHKDGSAVELHQVGSREFIQQSQQSAMASLEGKLGDASSGFGSGSFGRSESTKDNLGAAKIEYERKSQNQPGQQAIYGAQHDLLAKGQSKTETAMVGCNCGAEWTVTGQSTRANDPSNPAGGVKVEQYGHGGAGSAGQPGGYRAAGPGGEKQEYRTGAGQQQDYMG